MGVATKRMTVDEYFAVSVEGDHAQLIDGAMVVDEPRLRHQVAQARLVHAFVAWIDAGAGRGLAAPPINVVLDDHNVYGPDLVWYADPTRLDVDARRNPVPDLAVEIRSPGTWRYDVHVKKTRYEQHGLPELWLVDTVALVVLVFRRSTPDAPEFDVALELGEADALRSPQLPGFTLALTRLFAI